MSLKAIAPLSLFAALCALFLLTLDRNTRLVPSPLIGQPAPQAVLIGLTDGASFSPRQMQGKRWIMNVWASWCLACRQEHDILLALAKHPDIQLIGYNYKDTANQAMAWLNQWGNPYTTVVQDTKGQAGLDWGIYGVPETYLIDEANLIRYKHTGPIDQHALATIILPFINHGELPHDTN